MVSLRALFEFFSYNVPTTITHVVHKSTIHLTKSFQQKSLKNIVHLCFRHIRFVVQNTNIVLQWVPSVTNFADVIAEVLPEAIGLLSNIDLHFLFNYVSFFRIFIYILILGDYFYSTPASPPIGLSLYKSSFSLSISLGINTSTKYGFVHCISCLFLSVRLFLLFQLTRSLSFLLSSMSLGSAPTLGTPFSLEVLISPGCSLPGHSTSSPFSHRCCLGPATPGGEC